MVVWQLAVVVDLVVAADVTTCPGDLDTIPDQLALTLILILRCVFVLALFRI